MVQGEKEQAARRYQKKQSLLIRPAGTGWSVAGKKFPSISRRRQNLML